MERGQVMDVKYNAEIHTKAREVIKIKRLINQYVEDCVEAGICPKCGSKLMVKFTENKEDLSTYCSDRGCTFIK